MKKIIIGFISLLLVSCAANGGSPQIAYNKVDQFTGNKIIRTSYIPANNHYSMSLSMFSFLRFSKINDNYIIDLKVTLTSGEVFSIRTSDKLMLKLVNGEVLKFTPLEFKITCNGCGSNGLMNSGVEGIEQNYFASEAQIEKIIQNNL